MECLGQNQKGNLIYKTAYKEYWELKEKHRINNTDIYIIDDKGFYVCDGMIWGYTADGRDLPPSKRQQFFGPKKPVKKKVEVEKEKEKEVVKCMKPETAKEISFSLLDDKWLETSEEVERILKEASSK
jgi:hypothetical protein